MTSPGLFFLICKMGITVTGEGAASVNFVWAHCWGRQGVELAQNATWAEEIANKWWTMLARVALALAPEVSLSCLGVRGHPCQLPGCWLSVFCPRRYPGCLILYPLMALFPFCSGWLLNSHSERCKRFLAWSLLFLGGYMPGGQSGNLASSPQSSSLCFPWLI